MTYNLINELWSSVLYFPSEVEYDNCELIFFFPISAKRDDQLRREAAQLEENMCLDASDLEELDDDLDLNTSEISVCSEPEEVPKTEGNDQELAETKEAHDQIVAETADVNDQDMAKVEDLNEEEVSTALNVSQHL